MWVHNYYKYVQQLIKKNQNLPKFITVPLNIANI